MRGYTSLSENLWSEWVSSYLRRTVQDAILKSLQDSRDKFEKFKIFAANGCDQCHFQNLILLSRKKFRRFFTFQEFTLTLKYNIFLFARISCLRPPKSGLQCEKFGLIFTNFYRDIYLQQIRCISGASVKLKVNIYLLLVHVRVHAFP